MARDPFFDLVTDKQLLDEVFARGMARQLENRVFIDGGLARAHNPDEVYARAKAQALHGIVKFLAEQPDVVSYEREEVGNDYSTGSYKLVAVLGVLT